MAEYNALYTGTNGTDLSAYTSDSGHSHTKQSGSGSLQITSNALTCITVNESAFYTVDMTPSDADYELEFDMQIGTTSENYIIGMGIRCETDEDGIWVRYNGFEDLIELVKLVAGVDTVLDTYTIPASDANYNFRVAGSGGNVQWWVGDVDQGTHSLGGDLSAAGLIGFTKYSISSSGSEDNRILNASTTGASAGGTDYTGTVPAAALATVSGPVPGVSTLTRPYVLTTIA